MSVKHPLLGSKLPSSLVEIQNAIGMENTLKLVSVCGGTRIFIPKKVGVQHRLANLLGLKAAQQLSLHFGGENITVVRGAAAIRSLRNKEIFNRYDRGERVADLARSFALTERRIYAILSGPETA